ncbi:hypothetical protein H5410_029772 [Solanum commersonii]|uniref:DUF4283 domain-containing protein n=1 Tax=Solanum commersonii TaxID=4109 RepID=A0A9J5YDV1_SOLCO|nr:hypothetical protein H5410_029772 [Solanum commersonii]
MGNWKRQNKSNSIHDWIWIRVVGLPLHLWSNSTFREIGDRCGGWLEMKEETCKKNHLRWARIRVKTPREKILAAIDVEDGDMIFSIPIWLELPATHRKLTSHRKGENNS